MHLHDYLGIRVLVDRGLQDRVETPAIATALEHSPVVTGLLDDEHAARSLRPDRNRHGLIVVFREPRPDDPRPQRSGPLQLDRRRIQLRIVQ